MPAAPHRIEARCLIAEMIDHVGIAIEDSSAAVKRLVARKTMDLKSNLMNDVRSDQDILPLKLCITDIEKALATWSGDQRNEVGDGPGPYPIEGIAFSVLVHLVHMENAALGWGWTPEDLRAIGLDIQRDEEITWFSAESVEITDSRGSVRYRYRRQ